jgi:hypothetical protein
MNNESINFLKSLFVKYMFDFEKYSRYIVNTFLIEKIENDIRYLFECEFSTGIINETEYNNLNKTLKVTINTLNKHQVDIYVNIKGE